MKINKMNQLNVLSITAMIMVYIIHFCNRFVDDITNPIVTTLFLPLIRGFALIAVPIFIANFSYTYLYQKKEVSFRKLVFYFIIPAFIVTQITYYMFVDAESASWTISEGVYGYWFTNVVIGLMILVPLIQYLLKYKKTMFIFALIFNGLAYYYTIVDGNAAAANLGSLVFIAYIPVFILFKYLLFDFEYKNTKILVLITILGVLIQALAYYPSDVIAQYRTHIISYFSPYTIVYIFGFYKLIYNSDLKFKWFRELSETSYFFYITHYLSFGIMFNIYPKFSQNNVFLVFILGLSASLIVSFLFYNIYKKIMILLKFEKVKQKNYEVNYEKV